MKFGLSASLFLVLAIVQPPRALAQGGVTRHCISGASGSQISASGSASFTVNGGSGDLLLHSTSMPSGSFGRFFYGPTSTAPVPFGNGFRCVGAPLFRMPVLPQGSADFAVDYLMPPSVAGTITPGSTWNFQFWFRSGPSFDLSDAIEIRFVPPENLTTWSTIVEGEISMHPLGQLQAGGIQIIDDANEWAQFWAEYDPSFPPTAPPFVDFTQNQVLAVFAGLRTSGGYSFAIRRLELSITTLDVSTVERRPGNGCLVTAVMTQPHHIVLVPRVEHLAIGAWTRGVVVFDCP
jgi:PrcB C-terminal